MGCKIYWSITEVNQAISTNNIWQINGVGKTDTALTPTGLRSQSTWWGNLYT